MSTLTKLVAGLMGQLKAVRTASPAAASIELPPPAPGSDMSLHDALSERRSLRDFHPRPLPVAVLSNLLWSAFGVNRPETGGRTAPSALNAQEIEIYAALAGGLYRYNPKMHGLGLVAEADVRRVSGYQDFVDEAPLDLIYVADHGRSMAVPPRLRSVYAAASAGAIAQNVYLFCAAAGLATVVRGWFDRRSLGRALQLRARQEILLAQTVGYPKEAARRPTRAPSPLAELPPR